MIVGRPKSSAPRLGDGQCGAESVAVLPRVRFVGLEIDGLVGRLAIAVADEDASVSG